MPEFQFRARDAAGANQAGTIPSSDAAGAVAELRSRGWLVLQVRPAAAAGPAASAAIDRSEARAGILPPTSFDVEVGFRQISAMLRSGLTLLSSLKTAEEQARRPSMGRVWRLIYEQIAQGSSFGDAVRGHPRLFGPFVAELVRVGDQSGTTDYVLARAAEHLERSRQLRTTMMTAMFYPSMVLVAAIGVTVYMLVVLVPKMEKILRSRGRSLPAMTQALLDTSAFVQAYWFIIVATVAVVTLLFVLAYRRERPRLVIDRTLIRLPVFGKIIRVSGTAILARGMGLLLESGINLTDGLQTGASLMANRHQRQRVTLARSAVLQGGAMAENLADRSCFMPMLSKMVAVGESAGRLDTVLGEVARFHEEQLALLVRRLTVLIEPAIIVVVGSIVGFVYISFFVAMMAITGGGR